MGLLSDRQTRRGNQPARRPVRSKMQAIENQAAPAAPSSLDEVPADAVAVVAAYAGFFDRAKLAVCGKLMSQACATVKSDVLMGEEQI